MLSPWTVSDKKGLRNVSYKNSSSVLWFSENEKTLDEAVARDPALVLQSNTRVVRESNPLNLSVFTDVLQTGSQVIFQNDRRSYVSENLRRSIQAELRRNDLHQSRAGGTRTHDIRLLKHVLQLGSRSLSPIVSIAAEGEGVEPSSLFENRVSSAAQQTVSGYLPSY